MERPFRSVAPQRPRWNTRRCRWTMRIVCPHWTRSSRYVDNVEKFCRRVSVDVRFALRGAPRAAKLLPHADRADPKPKDHGSIAGQGRASQQKRTSHVRYGSSATEAIDAPRRSGEGVFIPAFSFPGFDSVPGVILAKHQPKFPTALRGLLAKPLLKQDR